MHLPPAASWKAGAAQWQRRLLGCLIALALIALLGFGSGQGWGARSLVLALSLLGCSVFAVWSLRGTASGKLRWDGAHWHWCGPADFAVTELFCVLDLQRLLLLYIRCEQGSTQWLWLHSRHMDADWLALRRAVVGSQATARSVEFDSLPE